MRQVSFVFQVSIYGLLALSGTMLARAEGAAFPQGLTLPLAALAFFVTERRGVFQIKPLAAFVLGILAFLFAASELFTDDLEAQLLSATHLLVYLSWIVLFQQKELRTYWWMLAISVLEVALGSVLTNDSTYGMLLALYLFWAFWTMSVFSLHMVQKRLARALDAAGGTAAFAFAGVPDNAMHRFQSAAAAPRMGWMLRRGSVARSSTHHEPHEQWISARFAMGIFLTSCLALVIGLIFFVIIPRFWIGQLSFSTDRSGRVQPPMTGFTEEVTLGEIGDILESSEPVMSVEILDEDADTGQPLGVEEYAARLGYDEPMFRGMVLENYAKGRWSTDLSQASNQRDGFPAMPLKGPPSTVRQRYILNPTGSSVLFTIPPAIAVEIAGLESPSRVNRLTTVLYRPFGVSGKKSVTYITYSPRPAPQPRAMSFPPVAGDSWRSTVVVAPIGVDRLKALAREVAGLNASDEKPEPLAMARRLEAYLRESGQFTYSLNASIKDPSLDPVEDFLFNRKSGHCEYYASALALMLRSVDIPSRLVSGFKGGDLNASTGLYQVQQRHAHAWVEGLIDGRWLVFDATPAAREASVQSLAPAASTWRNFRDLALTLWGTMLNIDLVQQHEKLYEPLRDAAVQSWKSASDERSSVSSLFSSAKNFLISPRRWISWQGGLASFVILLLGAGLLRLFLRWRSALAGLWARLWTRHVGANSRVDFYERFRKLCKARGLERRGSQTHQEFGGVVGESLKKVLQPAGLDDFPDRLIGSFYDVRFGLRELDAEQAREIHRRLNVLEETLSNGHARDPHREKA